MQEEKRLNHCQNYAKERGGENVSGIRIVSKICSVNLGLKHIPGPQQNAHVSTAYPERAQVIKY